ncbi:hypothetical protein FACS189459_5800 [Bacilli bacterium]|nr:hypothetical protein FACS189459_5800 [Bacilli bacterium]
MVAGLGIILPVCLTQCKPTNQQRVDLSKIIVNYTLPDKYNTFLDDKKIIDILWEESKKLNSNNYD